MTQKKVRHIDESENRESVIESDVVKTINHMPQIGWANFDVFWHKIVKKHSSATIKSACREHLVALGVWEDQSRWIEAVKDFGIEID